MTTNEGISNKGIFAHCVGGVAQNLVFGLWGAYAFFFFTEKVHIRPELIGALFLFAKIWDGINDPMMGVLADRTRTRWGRFRPWLLFMPIPVCIFLVLSFSVPPFESPLLRIMYIAVIYILMGTAFTAIDIPYWALPTVYTTNLQKRTRIYTAARLTSDMAGVAVYIGVPLIVAGFGDKNATKTYFNTAIVFGLLAVCLYFYAFRNIREYVPPQKKSLSFREIIKALSSNKPLMVLVGTQSIMQIPLFIQKTAVLYFSTYNLGSIGYTSILSAFLIPGIIIGSLGVVKLTKKYDKRRLYFLAGVLNFIVCTLFLLTGYSSIPLISLWIFLTGIQAGAITILGTTMIADTIEYVQWKTGIRAEGLISSAQTFTSKISVALGGLVLGILLSVIGYQEGADMQSQETIQGFHYLMSIVPGIIGLIGSIPILFYGVTNKLQAQIAKELVVRD